MIFGVSFATQVLIMYTAVRRRDAMPRFDAMNVGGNGRSDASRNQRREEMPERSVRKFFVARAKLRIDNRVAQKK